MVVFRDLQNKKAVIYSVALPCAIFSPWAFDLFIFSDSRRFASIARLGTSCNLGTNRLACQRQAISCVDVFRLGCGAKTIHVSRVSFHQRVPSDCCFGDLDWFRGDIFPITSTILFFWPSDTYRYCVRSELQYF